MGHPVPPEDGWVEGNDCQHCDAEKTPKYITVTLEGLSVCGGCFQVGAQSIKFFDSGNGAYRLEQYPEGPCRWDYQEIGALRRDIYSDVNCENFQETVYETLNIYVIRHADSVEIKAYASGYWPAKMIFFAEDIPVIKCVQTSWANNTTTCVAHEDRSAGGKGKVTEGLKA